MDCFVASLLAMTGNFNVRHSGACEARARNPYSRSGLWIPGLRQVAHPGMTVVMSRGPKPLPPHQLIREIRNRLAIDRGPVPLAHRLEICTPLVVGRAHLEA